MSSGSFQYLSSSKFDLPYYLSEFKVINPIRIEFEKLRLFYENLTSYGHKSIAME